MPYCVRNKTVPRIKAQFGGLTLLASINMKVLIYLMQLSIRHYSGPCILRPPIQPGKCGLKLEVVLKFKDIWIENKRMVPLIAGLKMEGIVKWRGLKSQGQLYCQVCH